MKVWKVEVWLKFKKSQPWENWENDNVVAENIEDAIAKAKAKQKEAYGKIYAVEVRAASLQLETTID